MHNDVWGCAEILPSRLVRFQSLSFQKAQNDLQVNVPVVKGTFVAALLQSCVTEQKYSHREGVEKQRREKRPVSVGFWFHFKWTFCNSLESFFLNFDGPSSRK